MKQFTRKHWFALSIIALVASTLLVSLRKAPTRKEKSAHIVVDRLVDRLVCKAPTSRDSSSSRFTRGMQPVSLPAITVRGGDNGKRWERPKDRGRDITMMIKRASPKKSPFAAK
jgi:hypothetical protein